MGKGGDERRLAVGVCVAVATTMLICPRWPDTVYHCIDQLIEPPKVGDVFLTRRAIRVDGDTNCQINRGEWLYVDGQAGDGRYYVIGEDSSGCEGVVNGAVNLARK